MTMYLTFLIESFQNVPTVLHDTKQLTHSDLHTNIIQSNDFEGAWHWIEKGADLAIHFDTYDFDVPHTSPILRGYSDGGWIMESEGNLSESMLDRLTTD